MKEELIRYRRKRAREALEDAAILFRSERLFSALNRIYYALFYEVAALLSTEDLYSGKHTGIRSLFNEHFVKTGRVPIELGRFYSRMYDFRQKGDYGDFVEFEKEKVKEWLDQASVFIDKMDAIIENRMKA
jgi:uncharacterized protein (UPF0332 family)